jgi:hypothetical protein
MGARALAAGEPPTRSRGEQEHDAREPPASKVEGSKSTSGRRTTDKEEGGARAQTLKNHRPVRLMGARALAAGDPPTRRRGSKSTDAREPPVDKVERSRSTSGHRNTDKEEGGARAQTTREPLVRWRGARALAAGEPPTRRRGSKSTDAREPPTGKVEWSKSTSGRRTTNKEEGGARAWTLENHRSTRWRGARALAAGEPSTWRRGEQELGQLENHRQGGGEQEH